VKKQLTYNDKEITYNVQEMDKQTPWPTSLFISA